MIGRRSSDVHRQNILAVAHRQNCRQRFAAGPFADDAGQEWQGEGMVIIRADSLEHAQEIAADDPMHKRGARKYRVLPWLLNEGSITLKVTYSNGGREVI